MISNADLELVQYLSGVSTNIQTQINSATSGGVTSLDGLSDVKAGGTNFTNSLLIGNTTTAFYGHYIGGSDTYEYGGWINYNNP